MRFEAEDLNPRFNSPHSSKERPCRASNTGALVEWLRVWGASMRGLLQNRFIQVIAAIAAAVAGLVGALALTPPANTAPPTTPAPAHPHHITRPKKHSAPSPDFPAPTTESPSSTVAAPAAPAATAPPPGLVVHVAGEVLHPNVYTLPASARIIDAVRAAGGVRRDADLDAVNLAAHI